jgi:phosphatidylglycerol:prolipoprotein diacylglycerol transferase
MEENTNKTGGDNASKESWSDKAEDVLQDLKGKAGQFADKAEVKFEELKDIAEDKFEVFKDKAEDAVDALKEKAAGAWDKLKDVFDGDEAPAKDPEAK